MASLLQMAFHLAPSLVEMMDVMRDQKKAAQMDENLALMMDELKVQTKVGLMDVKKVGQMAFQMAGSKAG